MAAETKSTAQKKSPKELFSDLYFDHKDIANLKRFMNQFGQIENRHRSSSNRDKPVLRACHQKKLSQAIKRARFLALIPFVKEDSDS